MGIDLGIIYLDFTEFLEVAGKSPFHAFFYLLINGGWLPIGIALLVGFKWVWMEYIQSKYASSWKWVLLLIDIPKENIQTPKAVENIFAQLAGAHSEPNFIEKYFKGKIQEPFSFEIASHEGYIRFYVRTTIQFRDLVEAAIYAQYPEAEIIEVEDYTTFAPNYFPNEEYELWGTELVLVNKQVYPIRTYPEFEHQLSQEFKDPMAALLEALTKLGPGEHVWLQIIIKPTSDKWKEEGIKIVKKLIGAKIEEKPTLIEKALGIPASILKEAFSSILTLPAQEAKNSKEIASLIQFLSPGERRIIEAIQLKISKIGFETKFRIIYLAKKEVFHKGRGVVPIIGAIKQFNTLDRNGFKPAKAVTTKIDYFMVKWRTASRQRKIMKAYKERSIYGGMTPYVLNIEELATIFHFPVRTVKAPLVRKIESKRGEPPINLPIETSPRQIFSKNNPKATPAPNLPTEDSASEAPFNLPVG
jgi:hypothetical protein